MLSSSHLSLPMNLVPKQPSAAESQDAPRPECSPELRSRRSQAQLLLPSLFLISDGALLEPGKTLVNIERKETSLAAEPLDV